MSAPQSKNQKTSTPVEPEKAAAVPTEAVEEVSWKLGDKAYITAVHGRMVHLFTNEEFGSRPVKVVIDNFVAAQLTAKKLAIADND